MKIRSCVCLEEILLALFFCFSFHHKFSLILFYIYFFSDSSNDIFDEFILISGWEGRIIQDGNIENSKGIERFFIFKYLEVEMWSCGHWSCTISTWRSTTLCDDITSFHELIWFHKNFGKMTIYCKITIWVLYS